MYYQWIGNDNYVSHQEFLEELLEYSNTPKEVRTMKRKKYKSPVDILMKLPWTYEVVPPIAPCPDWFVGVKECPGCMSQYKSSKNIIKKIRKIQREWLQICIDDGIAIQIPK